MLGRDRSYFVKKKKQHSDSTKTLSETDIINMLEFLIDNMFAIFGGRVFQQTVGILSYLWGTLKYNDTNKIVKFVIISTLKQNVCLLPSRISIRERI